MNRAEAKEYLAIAAEKSRRIAIRANGLIPTYGFSENGEYNCTEEGSWVDSFFPGMLYIAAACGFGEEYISLARVYDAAFDIKINEKLDIQDHDLGFMFTLKDVYDYKLTGSEFHKNRALKAAAKLLERYSDKAKILPAWDFHPFAPEVDYRGRIICDTMMNMPLLMWAYTQTGDERYKTAAVNHSKNSMRTLIREDGSAYHVYDFDPETGTPQEGHTMQGYNDNSCWTRGLSWLVYGFAIMYSYTKDAEFLAAAEKTARYFAEHVSAYGLPVWDFAVSEHEFRPWDASAGAVTVCGMLEIIRHERDAAARDYFEKSAKRIMNALNKLCSTMSIPELEPLLLHVAGAPVCREGTENTLVFPNVDTAIIFGDYFYNEALARFAEPDFEMPW